MEFNEENVVNAANVVRHKFDTIDSTITNMVLDNLQKVQGLFDFSKSSKEQDEKFYSLVDSVMQHIEDTYETWVMVYFINRLTVNKIILSMYNIPTFNNNFEKYKSLVIQARNSY